MHATGCSSCAPPSAMVVQARDSLQGVRDYPADLPRVLGKAGRRISSGVSSESYRGPGVVCSPCFWRPFFYHPSREEPLPLVSPASGWINGVITGSGTCALLCGVLLHPYIPCHKMMLGAAFRAPTSFGSLVTKACRSWLATLRHAAGGLPRNEAAKKVPELDEHEAPRGYLRAEVHPGEPRQKEGKMHATGEFWCFTRPLSPFWAKAASYLWVLCLLRVRQAVPAPLQHVCIDTCCLYRVETFTFVSNHAPTEKNAPGRQ